MVLQQENQRILLGSRGSPDYHFCVALGKGSTIIRERSSPTFYYLTSSSCSLPVTPWRKELNSDFERTIPNHYWQLGRGRWTESCSHTQSWSSRCALEPQHPQKTGRRTKTSSSTLWEVLSQHYSTRRPRVFDSSLSTCCIAKQYWLKALRRVKALYSSAPPPAFGLVNNKSSIKIREVTHNEHPVRHLEIDSPCTVWSELLQHLRPRRKQFSDIRGASFKDSSEIV